jgi:hypothetical protein
MPVHHQNHTRSSAENSPQANSARHPQAKLQPDILASGCCTHAPEGQEHNALIHACSAQSPVSSALPAAQHDHGPGCAHGACTHGEAQSEQKTAAAKRNIKPFIDVVSENIVLRYLQVFTGLLMIPMTGIMIASIWKSGSQTFQPPPATLTGIRHNQ